MQLLLGNIKAEIMTKMVRMSFTVPPEFRDNISYISMRLGISKSAVLSQILGEPLPSIVSMVREIPVDPSSTTPDTVKRFRDSSVVAINDAVTQLQDIFEDRDLFSGDVS